MTQSVVFCILMKIHVIDVQVQIPTISKTKKAKKDIQEDDKNNKKGGDITDEESNELDEIAKLKAAITDKNKQIVELRKKSILRQGTIRIKDDLILKTRKLENTIMDLKAELENLKNNEESLKLMLSKKKLKRILIY